MSAVPPAESGTHGMRYSRRDAYAVGGLAHRGECCNSGPLGRALAVVFGGLCFIVVCGAVSSVRFIISMSVVLAVRTVPRL